MKALAGILGAALSVFATACSSPAALSRVVLEYDEASARIEAEMLLLNIARARLDRPLHFTTVSGIAATFDLQASFGLGANLAEDAGVSALAPAFGVNLSENPTFSIVPIRGEEFTRQMLTPLDEATFGFFYHQGVEPEDLGALLGHGLIVESGERRFVYENSASPARAAEYLDFLERLAHLEDLGSLRVDPLVYEERWPIPEGSYPDANHLAELLELGYDLDPDDGSLTRRVIGRDILTDFDTATLSGEERAALQQRAQAYPASFVLVDMRGGADGREPLQGWLKLRSFGGVLDAVADELEHGDGVARSLPVRESDRAPDDPLFAVELEGRHLWIPRQVAIDGPSAFRVLHRTYQLTVTQVPESILPSLTIAK